MSLDENLSYIKYDLKSSHEAFKMFDITKDKFSSCPEIPASIVQKLAARSDVHPKNFDEKVFRRPEYKGMLRQIKDQRAILSNKQLVDSVFSIGKLHQKQNKEELS